ncbi:MAG: HAMP domain-containing protein [Salinarimonadaceae bacterium]|nr:MAG: HAMP domain-containing protein [Salinarimonadaceae bacterium]
MASDIASRKADPKGGTGERTDRVDVRRAENQERIDDKPLAPAQSQSSAGAFARLPRRWLRSAIMLRGWAGRGASSLTRRIVLLNLAGLVALLVGFLYLNQFREGLIEARVQSLKTQGEIIAGAIAASATVDIDSIKIDPDALLQMQLGETSGFGDDIFSPLEFSINPERVAPLLRRLITPTGTRARVYDREAMLILDSRALYSRGDILRLELPPLGGTPTSYPQRVWNWARSFFVAPRQPVLETIGPTNGRVFPEVNQALAAVSSSVVRLNPTGETIVSVGVPIQRQGSVRGVLLLSTQGGDIDGIIASERVALFQVFLVAAAVMVLLSVLQANAIAGPVRRLAEAAERVRRGIKSREEIPDFTYRSDEIGHLSGALRDMTQALYKRIDAIESFAADVAHELKNPLTSLRSAVETLPLAKTDDSRGRLLDIIQHDVRRLDRLISDISDASRLDAELARAEAAPFDLARLVEAVASVANDTRRPDEALIVVVRDPVPGRGAKGQPRSGQKGQARGNDSPYIVLGHDSRIGQVLRNLLDNARSFSPAGGEVRVRLTREGSDVVLIVDDDGPGIPDHALTRIFERFYTDRPDQGFGQNSGLGLSISQQIIQVHRGEIRAENRLGPADASGRRPVLGARFVVKLPAFAA